MKEENKELICCVTACERPLDQTYWNIQWENNTTNWDIGFSAPAIVSFFESYDNKNAPILIPGCGNAYEAEYLIGKGFTDITLIDIAPKAVDILKRKFIDYPQVKIICGDFFEHQAQYDVIVEQTFLSALPVTMRPKYVWKMFHLLQPKGRLIGLLFNRWFEFDKPPFGGTISEYEQMFKGAFGWNEMKNASESIESRKGIEMQLNLVKKDHVIVELYSFEGITCNGCMETVSDKIAQLSGVLNVRMSANYSELLIVSEQEVSLEELQGLISYEAHYRIKKV